MPAPSNSDYGFKRLTAENWRRIDPAWDGVVMSSSRQDPADAWVHDLSQATLNTSTPLALRRLFEIARGAMAYSLMFYPLLTLASEQLYRVLETAATAKCAMMNAPPLSNLTRQIEWLASKGIIPAEQRPRWEAAVYLRNESSHPKDQQILWPASALNALDSTIELINTLFPEEQAAA